MTLEPRNAGQPLTLEQYHLSPGGAQRHTLYLRIMSGVKSRKALNQSSQSLRHALYLRITLCGHMMVRKQRTGGAPG